MSYLILLPLTLIWVVIWYYNSAKKKKKSRILWIFIGLSSWILLLFLSGLMIYIWHILELFDSFVIFLFGIIGILVPKLILNKIYKELPDSESSENRTIVVSIAVTIAVIILLYFWETFNLFHVVSKTINTGDI